MLKNTNKYRGFTGSRVKWDLYIPLSIGKIGRAAATLFLRSM
jgi:hypothetical protein